MWTRRISLICAIAAGSWTALLSSGLLYDYVNNTDAWLLAALAPFPVVFAGLGLIGVFRSNPTLAALSSLLLAVFFFSPGLVGIPYLPAAGAMGLATVFAWLAWPGDQPSVHHPRGGDRFYGA